MNYVIMTVEYAIVPLADETRAETQARIEDLIPDIPGSRILSKIHSRVVRFESSHYVGYFDEATSRAWSSTPNEEYNWLFLRTQQNWSNDMLRLRGHLFLNEVYTTLGMKHTAEGALVGWIYDPETYVDFGCWETPKEEDKDEREKAGGIKLNFNAQGVIWDKLK